MGAFFTNFQVRTGSNKGVIEALKPLISARAYVSSSERNWVSVFDERTEDQNEEEIQRLAQGLSRSVGTPVFAFMVHDSDFFCYWLCRDGKLADKYNSRPDYFGSVAEEVRAQLAGKPEQLLPLCRTETTLEAIRGTLRQRTPRGRAPDANRTDPIYEEGRAAMLAAHLGISSERATISFTDLLEADAVDRKKFKLIKSAGYGQGLKRGKKLLEAVGRGSLADVQALITDGLSLSSPAAKEAVAAAAHSGRLDVLGCLVKAGARLETRIGGANLLGYAIASGSPAMVQFLLERGADANEANEGGATPLISATFVGDSGEVVEALISGGAEVNRSANVQFGSNSPAVLGVTPLMCAARFAAAEIAKMLLKHGADKDAVDALGRNALAFAQEKNAFYESVRQRPGVAVPDLIRSNSEKLTEIIRMLSPREK